MGNESSTIKQEIPQKYLCPVANKIMVNPTLIISSGNTYDKLTFDKWRKYLESQSRTIIDPLTGGMYIASQKCNSLQADIQHFIKKYGYNDPKYLVNEEIEWETLFSSCDKKIKQKQLKYEKVLRTLPIKGQQLLFPNEYDKNDNTLNWNEDLLLLLSLSKVPIITFMGPSRCGKSTLLNDILSSRDAFTTSDSAGKRETVGAWIVLYKKPVNYEEKEEKIDTPNMTYPEEFFLIDMEGLTNQATYFTYNVFYAVYAFSDVLVWNDKDVGRDEFTKLMKELEKTMKDISKSQNKPSFLFLRRDKNKKLDRNKYGIHKTLDRYINHDDIFKSFRELNLFTKISGYEIETRPGYDTPFSSQELNKLITHILALNVNDKGRFAMDYYELEKQLKNINKGKGLSLSTKVIMQHEVLKHFLFDGYEEKLNKIKILHYANTRKFDVHSIRSEFEKAMNDDDLKEYIDDDLKQRLNMGLEIVISCVNTKRDTLDIVPVGVEIAASPAIVVGGIASVIVGGIPGTAGGIIGGIADVIAYPLIPFVPDHVMGDCARSMAVKTIQEGVAGTKSLLNKNYCRYQFSSTNSYAVKSTLMAKGAIPMFLVHRNDGDNNDTKRFNVTFDHQLLPLISECNNSRIIIFMGNANVERSKFLNEWMNGKEIFMSSAEIKIPLITLITNTISTYIINMPNWNETVECKRFFYALYCIAHVIVWNDTDTDSKEFISFQRSISMDMDTVKSSKQKPAFVFALHANDPLGSVTIRRTHQLYAFKSISAHQVCGHNELYSFILTKCRNITSFVHNAAVFDRKADWQCGACRKRIDNKYSQCIHCGTFKCFEDNYNNEYSFYRQLININKYGTISYELQCIMEDKTLKYFLYEPDDSYQSMLMLHYAKQMKFNKDAIMKAFSYAEPHFYTNSKQQLFEGKSHYEYALSDLKEKWRVPFDNVIEPESDQHVQVEEYMTNETDVIKGGYILLQDNKEEEEPKDDTEEKQSGPISLSNRKVANYKHSGDEMMDESEQEVQIYNNQHDEEMEQKQEQIQEQEEKSIDDNDGFEADVADDCDTLPPNWKIYYTEDGYPYYHNVVTNVTQWDAPDLLFSV